MMYAFKYDKRIYKTVEDVCHDFIVSRFSDYYHPCFTDYIDFSGIVRNYLGLEIIETTKAYIILSEVDTKDLDRQFFE